MNFAEYVVILSSNTDLLDKAKLDKQITQLQKERVLFFRDIDKSKHDLKKLSEKKEAAESAVQDMKSDYDQFCKSKGVLISKDWERCRKISECMAVSKYGRRHNRIYWYL